MSSSAQSANGVEQVKEIVDTPVESSIGKGKGKMADDMPVDESEESEEEGAEGEVEEADEDNMEEIDTDNIVGSRTRGKNIDYAEAARQMEEEGDEDDEDDDDFQDEDSEMKD